MTASVSSHRPSSEERLPLPTPELERVAQAVLRAARSGGATELLRHGENALTYSPGDEVDLASRIQELQLQPALRQQMAETAQTEVLSRYNESTVMDQIENYLNTSLEVWAAAAT